MTGAKAGVLLEGGGRVKMAESSDVREVVYGQVSGLRAEVGGGI